MKLRCEIDQSAENMSDLTDLCVVWTQFMDGRGGAGGAPRGSAESVAAALRELSALQEFLYRNSGGRGVKILFVVTGPPVEWTPSQECILHKVAAILSVVSLAAVSAVSKAHK